MNFNTDDQYAIPEYLSRLLLQGINKSHLPIRIYVTDGQVSKDITDDIKEMLITYLFGHESEDD